MVCRLDVEEMNAFNDNKHQQIMSVILITLNFYIKNNHSQTQLFQTVHRGYKYFTLTGVRIFEE